MRNRRNAHRSIFRRLAGMAGAGLSRAGAAATRRPVDSFAILAAGGVSLVIVVNAVYLQSGSHPVPYLAMSKPAPVATGSAAMPAVPAAAVRPPAPAVAPQPVAMRRNDPIAELIGPSPRIAAVQRALSDYGYAQLKPSGMLDEATVAAIEKFEREHRLPPTGRVSDRFLGQLAVLVGHPIE